jgi:hypothetical protein
MLWFSGLPSAQNMERYTDFIAQEQIQKTGKLSHYLASTF